LRRLDSPSAPGTSILTVIRVGSEAGSILRQASSSPSMTERRDIGVIIDVAAGDNKNKVEGRRVAEVVAVLAAIGQCGRGGGVILYNKQVSTSIACEALTTRSTKQAYVVLHG